MCASAKKLIGPMTFYANLKIYRSKELWITTIAVMRYAHFPCKVLTADS